MAGEDDFVTVARSPDGRAYAIFLAAPGSALDSDSEVRVRLGERFARSRASWRAFRRSVATAYAFASGRWRVVVQEQLPDGRLGLVRSRSFFRDRAGADAEVQRLVEQIASSGR